jgi:hypothetical protein
LPQAKVFLPDVADWLVKALDSIEPLNSILQSDVLVAEQLIKLSKGLTPEFQEQREYLMKCEEKLKDVGMDPKWPRLRGRQSSFVGESMAGARWTLTPSTSRELVRQIRLNPRGPTLRILNIRQERNWWEAQE